MSEYFIRDIKKEKEIEYRKGRFFFQKVPGFLSGLQRHLHFSSLKLNIWILVIFKAAIASQRQPSCPYKALSFQTLRHPQFLSNFQSPQFKFSVSGKINVRLFVVTTKTSVLSEKNVPLNWVKMSRWVLNKRHDIFQKALDLTVASAVELWKSSFLW